MALKAEVTVNFEHHPEFIKRGGNKGTRKGVLVLDLGPFMIAAVHAMSVEFKHRTEAVGNILVDRSEPTQTSAGPALVYRLGDFQPVKTARATSVIVYPEDLDVPEGKTLCRVHSHLGYGSGPASEADIRAGSNIQKTFPDAFHAIINLPQNRDAKEVELKLWRVKDPYGSTALSNHEVLATMRIDVEELMDLLPGKRLKP